MLHIRHREWLEGRGLDGEMCLRMGLDTLERAGKKWLAIPYAEAGRVVNHKYRLISEKQFMMDAGAPLTLWNCEAMASDAVTSGQTALAICEGEIDAMTAIQCGWEATVSVPNGASKGDQKLEYLDRCQSWLKDVKWFILATDDDEAGIALREELARRLGPWRCKFVLYPDGCKDLNEVLLAYGSGEVIRILRTAKPYPIQGLYDFDDIPAPPEVEPISIGIPSLCEHLYVVPGTLGVFTGFAGAGKTSLSIGIISNLLRHGVGVALASFETQPKPILQTKLRAALAKCSDGDARHRDNADVDEIIREHFSLIYQQIDATNSFGVDDVLNLAAVAVQRKGIRLLWLDPWNQLEHKRPHGENETDYIGKALQTCRIFARDFGIAVWITAHPSLMAARDMKGLPTLYSIAGSAHFANSPDYGFVIGRDRKRENVVDVHVTKVRMGMPGKEGKISLRFDFRTSEYSLAPAGVSDDGEGVEPSGNGRSRKAARPLTGEMPLGGCPKDDADGSAWSLLDGATPAVLEQVPAAPMLDL